MHTRKCVAPCGPTGCSTAPCLTSESKGGTQPSTAMVGNAMPCKPVFFGGAMGATQHSCVILLVTAGCLCKPSKLDCLRQALAPKDKRCGPPTKMPSNLAATNVSPGSLTASAKAWLST